MKRVVLKVGSVIVAAIAIMACVFTPALAANKCSRGKVVGTGVVPTLASGNASAYMVQIECNSDTEYVGVKQFLLHVDIGDSGYATALTAMSLDREVYVEMTALIWNSIVERISIQPL
ncbi:MAG: hypothetical protein ACL93V_17250 [Candidatus Electrothrix sp. YB6]